MLAQTVPTQTVLAQASATSDISRWDWLIAGAIVLGALVLARVLQSLIVRFLRHGQKSPTFSEVLVGRFAAVIVTLVGIAYALSVLGVQISPLLGALGIGGVAVAFALQPTLQNLFAGVVLEAQRPFRRGDEISTNGFDGVVVDINSRSTVIVTLDGQRVFLPNTSVLESPIVNRVREGCRRSTVSVGVAYATDLTHAKNVLATALASVDGVLAEPPAMVWTTGFGESSIDFDLNVWHAADDVSMHQVIDGVIVAVESALTAAEITIPFPQRTIWQTSPDSFD